MNLPAIANTLEEKIQDVQVVIDNREKRLFKTGVVESLPKINDVIRQILPLYGIDASPEHLIELTKFISCLLYTSPSPRDLSTSRMPSSA